MNQPNVTEIQNQVVKAESWLKQHERLLIIVFCLIFSYFVLDKTFGLMASYESHKADQANAALAIEKSKNDAELAQAKTMLADYETALNNSIKENAALASAITARNKAVVVQQQADAKLPPSELALRWQKSVGDSGITVAPSGFAVSDSAALTTVQYLDLIPTLEANLNDEVKQNQNLQMNVDKANDLINQGKIVVNGLQLQLTDQTKACTIELAAEKAKARKSKLKWFGIGFVSGFVTGQVGKFFGI